MSSIVVLDQEEARFHISDTEYQEHLLRRNWYCRPTTRWPKTVHEAKCQTWKWSKRAPTSTSISWNRILRRKYLKWSLDSIITIFGWWFSIIISVFLTIYRPTSFSNVFLLLELQDYEAVHNANEVDQVFEFFRMTASKSESQESEVLY